ncbi:MAG: hypothetical protein Q9217_002555 [Psora testacea]
MADPLSIAGSVAGVASLGIAVAQSLVDFCKSYKCQDCELAGIIGRLESLVETLQRLKKALNDRICPAGERNLVGKIETSIENCDEFIQELRDECQKFSKTSSAGIKAAIKVAGRRVTYPFRQSTLQKLDEDIREIRDNLSFALDVLQLDDTQRLQDSVTEIKDLLEWVTTNQISSDLRGWLNVLDATVDHNAACAKKHPGTGTWLIKSSQFSKWLTEERSIVWLNGFAGSGNRYTSIASTAEYLRRLIQRFRHEYIFLDVLDESPRNGAREYVLNALKTIQKWDVQYLYFFVTSRDEPDIREPLDLPVTQKVIMQNVGIDKDIAYFISDRLREDGMLRKWLPYLNKIHETLTKGTRGVEDHLDKVLGSLPQSLHETYERMLCNIGDSLIEDARRILTLLCFARRPLKVQELIDGVAVELNGSTGLNRRRRLQDSDDIRVICPGFVEFGADQTSKAYDRRNFTLTVRIAHFYIQEYLISERIRDQKAANFSLDSVTANAEIAQICLFYLLEHDLSSSNLDQSLVEEFPLAQFAAMYWYHHYRDTVASAPAPRLDSLILKLFQCSDSLATWVKLHNIELPWLISIDFDRPLEIATPVYYASSLGLDQVLSKLIDKEQVGSVTTSALLFASMLMISE